MEKSSWIRKMFEEGIRLKQEFGEENVFDLSLGNPVAEPPGELLAALVATAKDYGPRLASLHAQCGVAGSPGDPCQDRSLPNARSISLPMTL